MPRSAQGSSLASAPAPFAPTLESPGSRWGQLAENLRVPVSAFTGGRALGGRVHLGEGPSWRRTPEQGPLGALRGALAPIRCVTEGCREQGEGGPWGGARPGGGWWPLHQDGVFREIAGVCMLFILVWGLL